MSPWGNTLHIQTIICLNVFAVLILINLHLFINIKEITVYTFKHPSIWLPLNDLCLLIVLYPSEYHSHICTRIGSCDRWNVAEGYYAIYGIRAKNNPSPSSSPSLPFFLPFPLFLSFYRRSQLSYHKDICLTNPIKRNSQALCYLEASLSAPAERAGGHRLTQYLNHNLMKLLDLEPSAKILTLKSHVRW